MRFEYDWSTAFILINRKITKEGFIEKTGVKHGYSFQMFSRMFDAIFSELIDLEQEFDKYYAVEYDSIGHMLYKKYNLTTENIEHILKAKNDNPSCILYRTNDGFSFGDYGIIQFAFSDPMYDRITDLLLFTDN